MRFAIRNADDRAAADETEGEQDARDFTPPAEGPDGFFEACDTLAMYEEYLSELDKVPTLRDPVLPEVSGQHFNLDEKIREIVRDELAKLYVEIETPKRSSSRSRKRRKR